MATQEPRASTVSHGERRWPLSEEQANAFVGLVRAGELVSRALDKGLTDRHGIGLHDFEVLLFLDNTTSDGCLPMIELRRRTPLSQSRVSRIVSGLEAKGLVRREPDLEDNRAVTVSITPQGRKVLEAARPQHRRDLDTHLFSVLSDREIRQLAATTTKILAGEQHRR